MPRRRNQDVRKRADFPGNPILSLNLKEHDQGYQVQLERAKRSIDRFTHFENEPISEGAYEGLLDDFFDAIEALRHCRDWVQAALAEYKAEDELAELLKQSKVLAAVADIGDASKHRKITRKPYFDGKLFLIADRPTQRYESLGDFYSSMRLLMGDETIHPAVFLHRAWNEWKRFAEQSLIVRDVEKRLTRTKPPF